MAYHIENSTGDPGQVEETSKFLAAFNAVGEVASRDLAEQKPEIWMDRLRRWWDESPYCGEDTPKGLLLRKESGEMAGFFGFNPHHYVIGEKIVPSLISTTTFVRSDSRDAALGMFLRAHRLREDYQLIDGGPNEKLAPLLEKSGYRHAERSKAYLYAPKRRSRRLGVILLRMAQLAGDPEGCGMPGEVDLLPWPVAGPRDVRRSRLAVSYAPKLFYRLPVRLGDAERACLPLEGDKAIL